MEITLHDKMLLTDRVELRVDASDNEENTIWVTTRTGLFKITSAGQVVFLGQQGEQDDGEIIHQNGKRQSQ